jgi:hypothetical protein
VGFIGSDQSCENIIKSCGIAINVIQKVILNTVASGRKELDIVGSVKDIVNGGDTLQAVGL